VGDGQSAFVLGSANLSAELIGNWDE